jgi:hypothetical protein
VKVLIWHRLRRGNPVAAGPIPTGGAVVPNVTGAR